MLYIHHPGMLIVQIVAEVTSGLSLTRTLEKTELSNFRTVCLLSCYLNNQRMKHTNYALTYFCSRISLVPNFKEKIWIEVICGEVTENNI
jgi:hypothetical protein